MPYETEEAVAIFARQHAKIDPMAHYKEREAAAAALLAAVKTAAKQAGYEVGPEHGAVCISHRTKGAVYLLLEDDKLRVAVNPGAGPLVEFPIEFDATSGMFVGNDPDTYLIPEPGRPVKRRNAVAVVAETVCSMIEKAAEEKLKSGRRT